MRQILLIAFLLPFCLLGQTCKSSASFNGHQGTSEFHTEEFSKGDKLEVVGDCGKFVVTSYEFTTKVKGQMVSYTGFGPKLTNDMKAALGSVAKGARVFFDNVKAKGTDGKIKNIPGITLNVK